MKRIVTSLVIIGLLSMTVLSVAAADTTVKVSSHDLETETDRFVAAVSSDKWFFYNDENDTIDNSLGSFVAGPEVAPAGDGSVQISVSGTERRNLATYQFRGTPLADITTLAYSTYNPSAGNGGSTNRSGYLNFNVDFDGSDTWQRRLIFLPSDNGTVQQDTWQEWDAINSGAALWRYSGPTWPGTVITGSTARTWSEILSAYPGVRIRVTDAWLGIRVGEPYADGYTENIDAFKFGTAAGTTTFDFDLPTTDELLDNLQNATAELVDHEKTERTLLAALARAERFMESRPQVARMALFQYILQVQLFDAFGLIDDEAADQLIQQAQQLSESLS